MILFLDPVGLIEIVKLVTDTQVTTLELIQTYCQIRLYMNRLFVIKITGGPLDKVRALRFPQEKNVNKPANWL